MTRSQNKAAPAVVLGLNHNALGVARSLTKAGLAVIMVGVKPSRWAQTDRWMSSRTWIARKAFLPKRYNDADVVALLNGLAQEFSGPLMVIPSGDAELLFLARQQAALKAHFRFHVPARETLDVLMNKGPFYDLCVRVGVTAPVTVRRLGRGASRSEVEALRFPVLVKPGFRDGRWNSRFSSEKGFTAQSVDQVMALGDSHADFAEELLAQELIPGPDSELYFSHAYISTDGRLRAIWTGRKIRQLPRGVGTSTLTEAVWVEEVAEATMRFAQELQLRGYVSVEFKRDSRDGTYRVIEVTPSRTWYPHYLGVAVGVNIPKLWYDDLMGNELPAEVVRPRRERVRWVDEYRDLISAASDWREGKLSLSKWIGSYARVRSFVLFSPRDPLPALFLAARLTISAYNAVVRLLVGK